QRLAFPPADGIPEPLADLVWQVRTAVERNVSIRAAAMTVLVINGQPSVTLDVPAERARAPHERQAETAAPVGRPVFGVVGAPAHGTVHRVGRRLRIAVNEGGRQFGWCCQSASPPRFLGPLLRLRGQRGNL